MTDPQQTISVRGRCLPADGHAQRRRLTVDLSDGRTIAVPLAWYPRLAHASPAERRNWR